MIVYGKNGETYKIKFLDTMKNHDKYRERS